MSEHVIIKVNSSYTAPDPMLGAALNWLNWKHAGSRLVAGFVPKAPLPVLGPVTNGQPSYALIEAINRHLGKLQYHSDPGGGTLDLYNHPGHTQYLLERQGPAEKRPRDCDDYAVFADELARVAGAAPHEAWIWNLLVANQFREMGWNHVILGIRCFDAPGRIYVLDTCSAAWGKPHAFTGTKESVASEVRARFGEIYKADYRYLVEVGNPFV